MGPDRPRGDVYASAGWIATGLKRFALRRATAVTVPNQEMRERLLQLGANPSTTLVRPMGADVAALRALRAERRGGKLLFVGRLAEKKGVAVLLEALRSADLGDDWSLEVSGDGPLRPRLEAAARGLGDRVRFLGSLDRAGVAAAMASWLGATAAAAVDAYSIEAVGEQYVELLGNLIAPPAAR